MRPAPELHARPHVFIRTPAAGRPMAPHQDGIPGKTDRRTPHDRFGCNGYTSGCGRIRKPLPGTPESDIT